MNSISKWKHTKYKTKGVSFDKRKNRYRAYIKINQLYYYTNTPLFQVIHSILPMRIE